MLSLFRTAGVRAALATSFRPLAFASRMALYSTNNMATKTLFVGNLPWSARSEDLRQLFGRIGEVKSARVVSDRETARSRGFGFVEMNAVDAETAVVELDGSDFMGRSIRIDNATQRTTYSREGGNGGNNRNDNYNASEERH